MKTQKELKVRLMEAEREVNKWHDKYAFWFSVGIVFLTCFIILTIFFVVVVFDKQDLQQQLSEYQDGVPVWTLKASCDIFFNTIDEKYELKFDNYKDYLAQRERVENTKGCEVIE